MPRRLPKPEEALAWPGLCVLLGLASLSVWVSGAQAGLAWHSTTWAREPWVLWTASLVHLSGPHLLANLVALVFLGGIGALLQAGKTATLALLVAWPLGTLALAQWPQISAYSGMSGLLNAMVAVLWAHAACHAAKPLSFIIFAALAIKLLGEHAWSQPIAFDPNWGFNVVYAAHLAGALAGALCGLAFEIAARAARKASP